MRIFQTLLADLEKREAEKVFKNSVRETNDDALAVEGDSGVSPKTVFISTIRTHLTLHSTYSHTSHNDLDGERAMGSYNVKINWLCESERVY